MVVLLNLINLAAFFLFMDIKETSVHKIVALIWNLEGSSQHFPQKQVDQHCRFEP